MEPGPGSAPDGKPRGLMYRPDRIRNICILAHVDHGKTTLSDYLVASNGYVHPKLAGRQRFLDWREEEQARGITMKSSSIALLYDPGEGDRHIVNLIDSPGHVDFCSEVSSAARLADGALLIVDAVEGVCVQTHAVIRQALGEKLKLCLFVNKLDRLIEELMMSPAEAYQRIFRIVSDVNNVVSEVAAEDYLRSQNEEEAGEEGASLQDDSLLFSPVKGNVAFGCALEGWAFRLGDFAAMYAERMCCNRANLQRALWGNFSYNGKAKKIARIKPTEGHKKPLFVQLVLEPLWQGCALAGMPASEAADAAVALSKKLGAEVQPKEVRGQEPRKVCQVLLSKWLPLCECVMSMVAEHLPGAQQGARDRFPQLLSVPAQRSSEAEGTIARLRFDADDDEVVLFVSKMIVVPSAELPEEHQADGEDTYLAFGRVFAGTLRDGQTVKVLSPGYDPSDPGRRCAPATVRGLFLMKGRDVEALPAAPAGIMVAIGGLSGALSRSATLSSSGQIYPFAAMTYQSSPILKVAVEPRDPAQMPSLARGLELLYRADPFVEVESSREGEHIICAAGEVHMATCVKELRERFAGIDLVTSEPLATFKEAVRVPRPGGHRGAATPQGLCSFHVDVWYVPDRAARLIDESKQVVATSLARGTQAEGGGGFAQELVSLCEGSEVDLSSVWCLGPENVGPNLLLAGTLQVEGGPGGEGEETVSCAIGTPRASLALGLRTSPATSEPPPSPELVDLARVVEDGVKSAFQMVSSAGPLCDESLWGVAFRVRATASWPRWQEVRGSEGGGESLGLISGQVITAARESLRGAVMASGPRIVEAQLACEVMTTSAGLSGTYASLGKRNAAILSEDMREGSDAFTIEALVPMADSFGFVDELRKRSSGASSATVSFSHWACNDEDPFFVPRTEEEREEHGEAGAFAHRNRSRRLLDGARRRKGLPVEEKLVASATKQRTLAKKV